MAVFTTLFLCLGLNVFPVTEAAAQTGHTGSLAYYHRQEVRQPQHKPTALERHMPELEKNISIRFKNATVERALREIVGHTRLRLSFDRALISIDKRVTLSLTDATVLEALWAVLSGTDLSLKLSRSGQLVLVRESSWAIQAPDTLHALPAVTGNIGGRVVDEHQEALPGVNVQIVGMTRGAATDIEGRYLITGVPEGTHDVQASFIGFRTQIVQGVTVTTGQTTALDFVLEEDVARLEEVVVVGYGTVRKRDLTGSVGKVDVEEATKVPVSRIDQAIQGRVPGVLVTSTNGRPGSGTTIRVRGGNSINAGNEPLYVIDGFVGGATIDSINPNDIESIEILKDASALSIYGARGSNGVVLITTKKGREGQADVSFSSQIGIQTLARKIDLMSAQEWMQFANDGEVFLGNPLAFTEEEIQQAGQGTDWQDVLIEDAPLYNAQLAIRGGTDRTKYYLSGNYFNQDGLLVGNEYDRSQLRLNLDHKASTFFEIGTSINLSRIQNVPHNFNIGAVQSLQPTLPVFLEDGSYSVFTDINNLVFTNPLSANEFIDNETNLNQLFTNTYVQLTPLTNLRVRSTFGLSLRDSKTNVFISSQLPSRLETGRSGEGSVATSNRTNILTENTLDYTPVTSTNHRLNLLAGFTYQRQETETANSISDAVLNDLLSFYGIGLSNPEDTRISSGFDAWRVSSLIGRINYSLLDKYLFTVTARRDGSSKFGENDRYAFFPSAAFAWRLSQEDFIQRLGLFDHLKLRLSYGQSGNSEGIGAFTRFQALGNGFTSLGRGSREVGITNTRLSNPDLKWETTDQYDIGLEFGFFGGRLSFELDYFFKETKNLLFTKEVPRQTGFSSRLENIGSLENKGFELLANAVIMDTPDFRWDASFNISTYNNEITDLGAETSIVTRTHGVNVSGPSGMLIVGEPLGIFTGFNVLGIYQSQEEIDADGLTNNYVPGEFRFEDINGDGTIDFDDITVVGDSNPDLFGGFQNTLAYKAFELSAFFQFVSGNDVYNIPKTAMVRAFSNAYSIFTDAWREDNPDGTAPRSQAQNAQSSNSFNVEDGSFLRLKTLQLAYRVPTQTLGSLGVESLRVYLTANNLFQIVGSDYSNFDPETNFHGTNDRLRGYDNINYPSAKTFVFGVDLTF